MHKPLILFIFCFQPCLLSAEGSGEKGGREEKGVPPVNAGLFTRERWSLEGSIQSFNASGEKFVRRGYVVDASRSAAGMSDSPPGIIFKLSAPLLMYIFWLSQSNGNGRK
jgi:hypothetical protein